MTNPPPHAPRAARRSSPPKLEPRDLELLRCFTAFRLATVADLYPLLAQHFARPFLLWRRMQRLAAHNYLAQPPAQTLRLYEKRGRPADLYALGSAGARVLRSDGCTLPSVDFTAKARAFKPYSLEHPLATTRAVLPFILALRTAPHLELLHLFPDGAVSYSVRALVNDIPELLPLRPDATLVIYDTRDRTRLALFLEVDRGTAPKARTGVAGSSFRRKVLAYHAAHQTKATYLTPLEADDFLVLTVAPNAHRLNALRITTTGLLPHATSHDLFWFTTPGELTAANPTRALADIWTTAAGKTGALFDP